MPITITVKNNGPFVIAPQETSGVQIIDHEGNVFPPPAEGKSISLCRCGQSAKKPFCDGSHKTNGFTGSV